MKKFFKDEYIIYGIILILLLFLGSKLYETKTQGQPIPQENVIENTKNSSASKASQKQISEAEEPQKIYVHVSGRVAKPGLIQLKAGARTIEALQKAGGALPDANLDSINLAKILKDEDKIIVNSKNSPAGPSTSSVSQEKKINISTANEKELTDIPGVGEKTAQKIIQYREQNPFHSVEDLKNVPGIGEKKFEQMKDSVLCQ